jgi:hypothetical protein
MGLILRLASTRPLAESLMESEDSAVGSPCRRSLLQKGILGISRTSELAQAIILPIHTFKAAHKSYGIKQILDNCRATYVSRSHAYKPGKHLSRDVPSPAYLYRQKGTPTSYNINPRSDRRHNTQADLVRTRSRICISSTQVSGVCNTSLLNHTNVGPRNGVLSTWAARIRGFVSMHVDGAGAMAVDWDAVGYWESGARDIKG